MKREQALNTPAASILIALARQNKAEVLTFIRVDIERQGREMQDRFLTFAFRAMALIFCFLLPFPSASNLSWKEGERQVKLPKKQITQLE